MGVDGPDRSQASPAGTALTTVRHWMNGKMLPCTVKHKTGGYSCLIDYGHGNRGVVRWNPKRTVTMHAPKGTTLMTDYRGQTHHKPIKRVRVGEFPVLYLLQRHELAARAPVHIPGRVVVGWRRPRPPDR